MNLADAQGLLIVDQAVRVVVCIFVLDGSVVENSRNDRCKFNSFLVVAHVHRVTILILLAEDLRGPFYVVQSYLVLAHFRVDRAKINEALA